MRPGLHIALSVGVSAVIGAFLKSTPAFFASLAGGVLIDIDHVLDYFINYSPRFDLKDMYDKFIRMDLARLYILLHSYELTFIMWVVVYMTGSCILPVAFAAGFTVHMIFDQVTNPVKIQGYFLLYRAMSSFKTSQIARGK